MILAVGIPNGINAMFQFEAGDQYGIHNGERLRAAQATSKICMEKSERHRGYQYQHRPDDGLIEQCAWEQRAGKEEEAVYYVLKS